MKKKIAILIASLLTTNAMASMNSTTYADPMTRGTQNQITEVFTKHDWSISNDTTSAQNVLVCYDTIVCPNSRWTQTEHKCDQIALNSMETKSGSFTQDVKRYYVFIGACPVHATTTMTGWISQSSSSDGKLYITP